MLYNAVYDELITAGKAGVKVWYCEPDYKAFAKNAAAPLRSGARSSPLSGFAPTSMSKLKGGRAPPWQLGAFQSIRERITFRVPGANQQRVPNKVGVVKQADWCQQAFLQEQLQLLYVPIQGSVYGFRIDDGERVYNWENLHKQLVTAVVHPAGSNHIITGSHDMTAKLWALSQNGELQFLHIFAHTAAPLQSITLHPSGQSILMALADGTITLWQLDTLSELYRYKHDGPVKGLTFTDTDDFHFFSGRQVCALQLQHLFTTFRGCNSPAMQLDLLEDASVLMSFQDGCVRICEAATRQDTLVTLPQLSTRSPRCVRVNLALKRVYVLMSNGHIHVWRMHSQGPPTLVSVWDKLTPNHKDLALSMTLMPKGQLDPALAEMQGLTMTDEGRCGDHVVVGTKAGDCLFLDAEHDGQVMLCFPAHRGDPIDLVEVDAGRQRMLTASGDLVKLWAMKGHRALKELRFTEMLTHLETMGPLVVLGGDAGGVHLVNLESGDLLASPKAEDHDSPVTGLSAHMTLQHFISCGTDGMIKVYDRRKQLKRTMHLLEPVFSASFLNDQGDIIAALNKKLVVIRADSYQFLTADEMANLLIDYAKSQLQQQPGQPLSQAALNAQRAAAQLAASGSKVPTTLPHAGLSTQLSMAPEPLMQADLLQGLQACSLDAKLSIFEDTLPGADVSPAGVIAKVATAAKAWQKIRASKHKPDAEQTAGSTSRAKAALQHDSSMAETSSVPDRRTDTDLWQKLPSGAVRDRDTAAGSGADGAGSSPAAVPVGGGSSSHAAGVQPTDDRGVGSSAFDRQPCHRVGFAKAEGEPADAAIGRDIALPERAGAVQGRQGEEHASDAELRARLAARVRRAAGGGHDTISLHSTLRHIKKELNQSQAEHDRQRPAATASVTGPARIVSPEGPEPAGAEQAPADVATATPATEADSDSSDDTADSASTRGSGAESGGEQGAVAGLSDFMAEALRVVSAPDAFLQQDQGHRSIALPCFSFNKHGALVKSMSKKRSLASPGAGGLYQSSSLTPSASDAASVASAHMQQGVTRQQPPRAAGGQPGGALLAVPEDAVLGTSLSNQPPQAQEPKKVVKKRRKKKVKRRSRLSQLGGMSDLERSRWMLEHCKVVCVASCQPSVLTGH
ncbi:hypothetical protein ABBQ38_003321 [Trebouxia sp. C0009 RCD-2024]